MKSSIVDAPPGYPDGYLIPTSGRIFKRVEQVKTNLTYAWYMDGYFRTPEILHKYWDEYGCPSEHINDEINYSPKIWDEFVGAVAWGQSTQTATFEYDSKFITKVFITI